MTDSEDRAIDPRAMDSAPLDPRQRPVWDAVLASTAGDLATLPPCIVLISHPDSEMANVVYAGHIRETVSLALTSLVQVLAPQFPAAARDLDAVYQKWVDAWDNAAVSRTMMETLDAASDPDTTPEQLAELMKKGLNL